MGVGSLIAWRRASLESLKRNFLWPVALGIVAAAAAFALGVRSLLAALTFATTVFVAATIVVDFTRATRARLRVGESLLPAMGGLLLQHNRRYGGFVVHLGILIIALGVMGSHAWSVQTETTLHRGESAEKLLARVRGSPRSRSRTTSRSSGRSRCRTGACSACCARPRSSTLKNRRPSRTSTIVWACARISISSSATSPATAHRRRSSSRSTAS
jgi:hypothetical protein